MWAGVAGIRANVDLPVPLARRRARSGALKSVPGHRGSFEADLLVASCVAKQQYFPVLSSLDTGSNPLGSASLIPRWADQSREQGSVGVIDRHWILGRTDDDLVKSRP